MRFRWEEVADPVKEGAVVWAIDVAEIERYRVLMDSDRQVVVPRSRRTRPRHRRSLSG